MKQVPASVRDLRMPALPAASAAIAETYGFMKFNKKR
jgi:hypothetical protein